VVEKNVLFSHGPVSDWELALKLFPSAMIAPVNEKLYFYRMSAQQESRISNYNPKSMASFIRQWRENSMKISRIELRDDEIIKLVLPRANPRISISENLINWMCDFIAYEDNFPLRTLIQSRVLYWQFQSRKYIPSPILQPRSRFSADLAVLKI